MTESPPPLRHAVIGVGAGIFRSHRRALETVGAEFVGVSDVNEATAGERAAELGCPAYLDHRRMLDETRPDNNQLAFELVDRDSWELADKVAIRLERRAHLDNILYRLPTPAATVIRLKWGLTADGIEYDNKQIAAHFGKSSEWVRLRLRQAERHIRLTGLDRTRRRLRGFVRRSELHVAR